MVFEKLKEVIEIRVEYEALSALAIQAGKEVGLSAVERPIQEIGGKPVIPGSTLKGALRSILESMFSENKIPVCVPLAAIPQNEMPRLDDYVKRIGREKPCEDRRKICPICQIFGAAGISGRANFLDAKPVDVIKRIERTHVAIDRESKVAAGKKLMTLQAIDAGAKFGGIIRIVNPEKWQVGALLKAFESLDYMGLGSKKTSGYGEIKTTVKSINEKTLENGNWVEKKAGTEQFLKAFEDFLKEKKG